jgi:AmmeMemoRadiSam system protein B
MNARAETLTRPPSVAGLFYPDAPKALAAEVDAMLAAARLGLRAGARAPKVLVLPHAGYAYSGPIAAAGYALLASSAQHVRRVVLLGPAHRAYVRGLALPTALTFSTPLGPIPVDPDAAQALAGLTQVVVDARAHAREHSLEVHLPFLQRALGSFSLVPLVVGDATPNEVAAVLDRLWGGDETLIVLSSDLSHYQPYEVACEVDGRTCDAISAGRLVHAEQACGARVLNGLAALRTRRTLVPRVLDLRNSGDTAGERDEVVGYLAMAFDEGAGP